MNRTSGIVSANAVVITAGKWWFKSHLRARMLALLACALVGGGAFTSTGSACAADGDAVIAAVDQHEDGYTNLRANVTMLLESANGRKRERVLTISAVEITPLGDHRKFVFSKPTDVKGTAVLIHSKVTDDDDQWIYLPAFKRVKRIASTNKSTPFVGSEFSYEDLSSQEQQKYANHWVGTAEVDALLCDVIERTPRYANSAYSKVLAYVDQARSRYRKLEYFDKAGSLLKTQYLTDYQTYNQRYQLPNQTVMHNHQTGKKTIMLWEDIRLGTQLSKADFTVASLKRSR